MESNMQEIPTLSGTEPVEHPPEDAVPLLSQSPSDSCSPTRNFQEWVTKCVSSTCRTTQQTFVRWKMLLRFRSDEKVLSRGGRVVVHDSVPADMWTACGCLFFVLLVFGGLTIEWGMDSVRIVTMHDIFITGMQALQFFLLSGFVLLTSMAVGRIVSTYERRDGRLVITALALNALILPSFPIACYFILGLLPWMLFSWAAAVILCLHSQMVAVIVGISRKQQRLEHRLSTSGRKVLEVIEHQRSCRLDLMSFQLSVAMSLASASFITCCSDQQHYYVTPFFVCCTLGCSIIFLIASFWRLEVTSSAESAVVDWEMAKHLEDGIWSDTL